MAAVIEANNLGFGYGRELIFSGVGFSVNAGDFAAITGVNGAGKSTLLRLILGELTPKEGEIRLFNKDVRHFKDWRRVGYLPQKGLASGTAFPATAEEIVRANLYSEIGLLRAAKKRHREKALAALDMVGMAGEASSMLGELSGGQQQRVMLARVLVGQPDIMLLDEPTTGIDPASVVSLFSLLKQLNTEKGLTVVMVTHDVARAADYASRVLCLEEGSMVELDSCQIELELAHRHKHPPRE
jgi:zinc transport system ATP-binding protein